MTVLISESFFRRARQRRGLFKPFDQGESEQLVQSWFETATYVKLSCATRNGIEVNAMHGWTILSPAATK